MGRSKKHLQQLFFATCLTAMAAIMGTGWLPFAFAMPVTGPAGGHPLPPASGSAARPTATGVPPTNTPLPPPPTATPVPTNTTQPPATPVPPTNTPVPPPTQAPANTPVPQPTVPPAPTNTPTPTATPVPPAQPTNTPLPPPTQTPTPPPFTPTTAPTWTVPPEVSSGAIRGSVWNDLNRDGLRSLSEPPLAGAIVSLYAEGGQLVAQMTTGEDGLFSFDNLVAGRYRVTEKDPAGFQSATADEVWVNVQAQTVSQLTFADFQPSSPTERTPEPTPRFTPTLGPTPTNTPIPTPTNTLVPVPTATTIPPTSAPVDTAVPTNTPVATDTPQASPTLYPITPVATGVAFEVVNATLPVTGAGQLMLWWALALLVLGLAARWLRTRLRA